MVDENLKRLDDKIELLKRRRVKMVEWKLTKTQKEYIEEKLGKQKVIPQTYKVCTKTFKNLNGIQNSIIREIHYACKDGKRVIGKHLKIKEIKELEKYGIKLTPIQFRIYLN